MKKLLQKIISMAVVTAVLCPSISSAQENSSVKEEPSTAQLFQWFGGIVAVAGAVTWYTSNGELDDCKKLNTSNTKCGNQSDLEDDVNFGLVATALGAGAVAVGFAIDEDGPFQVRPIRNGVALERDGFSFSAVANGRVRLEKRWEF